MENSVIDKKEKKQKLDSLILDNKKKKIELSKKQQDMVINEREMLINEIKCIQSLMTQSIDDKVGSIISGDIKQELFFKDDELFKLKAKLWELVKKM